MIKDISPEYIAFNAISGQNWDALIEATNSSKDVIELFQLKALYNGSNYIRNSSTFDCFVEKYNNLKVKGKQND